MLPYCLMQQVTIIAYTPLDDGRLATRSWFPAELADASHPEVAVYMQRMQALEQVAAHMQKSLAQVALNWCTSR
jgi:aryl-alcohol dehydrogenase-like predicted oxidoreductase